MILKDQVVLITGASSRIGAATARAFDREGAKTAIAARNLDKLKDVAETLINSLILQTDLSDESQARKMVDATINHFGRIDILINNAATIIVSRSESVSGEDLLKAFRSNLVGPVIATQQALKNMKQNGGGHIINVGSPGFMMGIPFYAPYVCSKAAFSAWTRTIQAEWAGNGIIVSEYFPGYILTDSHPESRIGEVHLDFLMSEKQNFITRKFAKPKSAETVADHLVKLAKKPRPLMHSGFGVKLGTFISNIPAFRLSIARQMAETAKKKLGSS